LPHFALVALTPAVDEIALAAAADRQPLIDGSIQRLKFQIGGQWLNLADVPDRRLAMADRRLPGQAGSMDRSTRSTWHPVGSSLAGQSHGTRAEYHHADDRPFEE
jgi:hypothetical protein